MADDAPDKTSETLDSLVKIFGLINGTMPILSTLMENEMRVVGMTREERYAMRKRLFGETRAIADDLQGDKEDI